jgi:protein SCO1/2
VKGVEVPRLSAPAKRAILLPFFAAAAMTAVILATSPQITNLEGEDTELAILGTAPAFSLTDQEGRTVTDAALRGNVLVLDFFFTSCRTVCPVQTSRMAQVQEQLEDTAGVHLISFSVDPETDTPDVLKAYAGRYGADPTRWSFLTGAPEAMDKVVAGYWQIVERIPRPDGAGFDIAHSERFVLVDRAGQIRGFYKTDEGGLAHLMKDLGTAMNEQG